MSLMSSFDWWIYDWRKYVTGWLHTLAALQANRATRAYSNAQRQLTSRVGVLPSIASNTGGSTCAQQQSFLMLARSLSSIRMSINQHLFLLPVILSNTAIHFFFGVSRNLSDHFQKFHSHTESGSQNARAHMLLWAIFSIKSTFDSDRYKHHRTT